MARTTKKGSKNNKLILRRPNVKTPLAKQAQTIAELRQQLAESLQRENATAKRENATAKELRDRDRQLTEASEQQKATSEILRVIASSVTDSQAVLDTVAANAARLCDASNVGIWRTDGENCWPVVFKGSIPVPRVGPRRMIRESNVARSMIDRQIIHCPDMLSPETRAEFPESSATAERLGVRTALIVPLLRETDAIGAIHLRRNEVRPFSDKQIALVKTFADQAVIAIENVRLFNELKESLEQQTATSEILGVIASSPTDVQPVLDAVAATAARLCDASDAVIDRVEGENVLEHVAVYGPMPVAKSQRPLTRSTPACRAIIDRQTIHVNDLAAELETEFPESKTRQAVTGTRTILATPMLREGAPLGVIVIRRTEVRPFSDRQVALLKTFADQAVIAIENVRLFKELQERNAELREALEHQTATSEVLGIISRSPTDVQPVLDAIVESAARVCGIDDLGLRLRDGNDFVSRARFGPLAAGFSYERISIDEPRFRWAVEHGTLHIPDAQAQNDFPNLGVFSKARTYLLVLLRQQGQVIGTLNARRVEVRPFTPAQIKLLETFADQAVIAIENVRLFNELKESLEQQTATSEILRVIASSPTDIQPVLDAVAETAARLCEASDAQIILVENDFIRPVAHYGTQPARSRDDKQPISRAVVTTRAITDRKTIHVHDLAAEVETEFPESKQFQQRFGTRTILVTPLMREGVPIGAIFIRRTEVRPFSDKQIKLLETFADQAVIAIENVRLFQELETRTDELAQSVEELKALGEVGHAVSSTLDLPTVLSTIVRHAVELSATDCGVIYEYDDHDETFQLRASHRMEQELVEAIRSAPLKVGEGYTGHAALERAPIQVSDLRNEREIRLTRIRPISDRLGYRSLLTVPILLENRLMGALTVWRKTAGTFVPELVNLLQTFATQSALAIQNARLFREIEDKSRQIEAANRHKSEFLANMSHELRTPLNAIIGFSEVLQEKLFGELNEKQAEYTSDILTSGQHLLSLINEILDLSKVEAGRMELELTPFDLPLAIDNARTFVRERAVKHGITLDADVDDRLGEYVGDERKIKQILLNLLSNAVKFTPEGGRISIIANKTDDGAEISVSDTGIGIPPAEQATIFEEFRQVGKGSTFTFTLPERPIAH